MMNKHLDHDITPPAPEMDFRPAGMKSTLAPRPVTLADTGLDEFFLADLTAKHLLEGGVLTLTALSGRIKLAGTIIESILRFMRKEALVEVRGSNGNAISADLHYTLTERGRQVAQDATMRSGYVGPAPVPLCRYREIAEAQTIHGQTITASQMQTAFADVIIRREILNQLGPAMNSGRAMFIYGPAGTGKTYISQKLVRLYSDHTLVPYSIEINGSVVELFDPLVHRPAGPDGDTLDPIFERGHDPRLVRCHRPVLISGGELTADMLEVHYDPATRRYRAPLQLKANNGVFIIDDMGRQRIPPETVFNRWIVPLEEKKDYLSLGAGRHFSVPFDTVLIFSTNLHPLDLADEAFLRRIGYKIEFPHLRVGEFEMIWRQFCIQNDIECAPGVFEFVTQDLYEDARMPMLPCHPRDLLGIAMDRARYACEEPVIDNDCMQWAWKNYFVSLKNDLGIRKAHRKTEDDSHV